MPSINWATLAILAGFAAIDGDALRLLDIRFPEVAVYGESITMSCIFELNGPDDVLYSVRWYKNSLEFYRYIPQAKPKKLIFMDQGINVDAESSDERSVRLVHLTPHSAGVYDCEVSVDAPSFLTAFARRNLSVIVPPAHKPNISGIESSYAPGDTIRGNCTTDPSLPPAEIRWLLNGVEVGPEFLQRPSPTNSSTPSKRYDSLKPVSTWLAINLPVPIHLFEDQEWIEITCEDQFASESPRKQVARVSLQHRQPAVDTVPTAVLESVDVDIDVGVSDWSNSNDRLAQRSAPRKSGSKGLQLDMAGLLLLGCSIVLPIISDVQSTTKLISWFTNSLT